MNVIFVVKGCQKLLSQGRNHLLSSLADAKILIATQPEMPSWPRSRYEACTKSCSIPTERVSISTGDWLQAVSSGSFGPSCIWITQFWETHTPLYAPSHLEHWINLPSCKDEGHLCIATGGVNDSSYRHAHGSCTLGSSLKIDMRMQWCQLQTGCASLLTPRFVLKWHWCPCHSVLTSTYSNEPARVQLPWVHLSGLPFRPQLPVPLQLCSYAAVPFLV